MLLKSRHKKKKLKLRPFNDQRPQRCRDQSLMPRHEEELSKRNSCGDINLRSWPKEKRKGGNLVATKN